MRLDLFLIQCELASDIKEATGLILSGKVLVNDTPATKCGMHIRTDDSVRLRDIKEYVARSAHKLEAALNHFDIAVKNKICIDVGSSTGGFTEILLKYEAAKVYAVDVAYGFLHPALRNDSRVIVYERKHICDMNSADFPDASIFTVDVSFISLRKVIPCLKNILPKAQAILLFKPQFEAEKKYLEKGIFNQEHSDILLQDFESFLEESKIFHQSHIKSPVKGTKGNQEFLYFVSWERV